MHVNPSQPASHEAMGVDQLEHLEVLRRWDRWKLTEELENRAALAERAARQLADYEGMAACFASFEQLTKSRTTNAEVIYPD